MRGLPSGLEIQISTDNTIGPKETDMNKNIFAYTPPGSDFPPFVSLNERDDGNVTLTVRGSRTEHDAGPTVDVVIPEEQLYAMAAAIVSRRVD